LSSDSPDGRKALNENKERGRGEPISALISKLERFVDNLGRDENYDEGAFFRLIYNLAELSEGLNDSVNGLNQIISSLSKNQSEDNGVIFRLLNNFANLSEELKMTNGILMSNLTSFNTLIENYQQPDGLIARMIDPSGKEIIQPASESLLLLQKTLKELSELSEFANTNSPELLLLISEGKKALDEVQKTLEGINSNPLIKGGITRPEEPIPGSKIRQERE
jgi:ABC-type transporter Mla subunit MlaD